MSRLAMALVLLVAACGGGGGDGGGDVPATTDTVTGDVAPDGTVDQDVPVGPSEVAPDGPLPDQGTGDAPVGPDGPFSAEFLAAACGVHCVYLEQCAGTPPGETCVADCVSAAEQDLAVGKQRVCAYALVDSDDDDFCQAETTCAEPYDSVAACETFCTAADGCGAIGNDALGYNTDDCLWTCSAFSTFEDGGAGAVDCMSTALETCSGAAFGVCLAGGEQFDPCNQALCPADGVAECGVVPGLFDTLDACSQACSGFTAGQKLASDSCMSASSEWPLACADRVSACMKVPAEIPEGAKEYCAVMVDTCGGTLGADMGPLTEESCAWALAGVTSALPALFLSFTDALPCAESLAQCPPGEGGSLACLVKNTPEQVTACATLLTVCQPAEHAHDMELTCKMAMAFIGVVFPEGLQGIMDCMNAAQDCDAKMACFPGE